jgi:hypothetical protein
MHLEARQGNVIVAPRHRAQGRGQSVEAKRDRPPDKIGDGDEGKQERQDCQSDADADVDEMREIVVEIKPGAHHQAKFGKRLGVRNLFARAAIALLGPGVGDISGAVFAHQIHQSLEWQTARAVAHAQQACSFHLRRGRGEKGAPV